MTTIHAQAERKRQDRSVCRAEKRLCRARMLRVRGLIHPTSAVCATTDTARGEKRLPSEQNQAILKSSGRPLGECRFLTLKLGRSAYCLQIEGRMSIPATSIQQYYEAIVEGSNDAIIAKDLDSRILSWNPAAERMFGYTEGEVLGKKIHFLIPEERRDEEANFISRLRQGERIENFETIRVNKDGSRFPISVSISPIRDDAGHVIGASKIARDITARHFAAEQQSLLLSEMQHRVGNSFAIASGLLGLSASHSSTIDELVRDMRGRLTALASAHSLAAPKNASGEGGERGFKSILDAILSAFSVAGNVIEDVEDIPIKGAAVTPLSIIFYELCTNSIKYGALSEQNGSLSISAKRCEAKFCISWRERFSGEAAKQVNTSQGLGSLLCKMAAEEQLGGSLKRTIHAGEVSVMLDIDLANIVV